MLNQVDLGRFAVNWRPLCYSSLEVVEDSAPYIFIHFELEFSNCCQQICHDVTLQSLENRSRSVDSTACLKQEGFAQSKLSGAFMIMFACQTGGSQ